MSEVKNKKKKSSMIQVSIGVLAVILAILIIIMMGIVSDIQGTARIVNYTGLVRGETQRIIKLEVAGEQDDAFEAVFSAELHAGVRRVDAKYQFVLGFHRHDVDRRADGAQLFVSCHFLALFNAYRPHVGIGGYIFAVSHENVVFVRDTVALDFDDLSVVDRNDVRTLGAGDLGHVFLVAFYRTGRDGKPQPSGLGRERRTLGIAFGEFAQLADGHVELVLHSDSSPRRLPSACLSGLSLAGRLLPFPFERCRGACPVVSPQVRSLPFPACLFTDNTIFDRS